MHQETLPTQQRFILSLALTGLILAAEIVGGLWTGSLALLSDAAHVFLDVFALGLSYISPRASLSCAMRATEKVATEENCDQNRR